MADVGSSVDVAKTIGDPLGTLIGWLAGRLPEGPARTLLFVVVGLCVAVAPFIYKYYLGVLAQGAAPEGSLERQDYDRLRASLKGDNLAARLYAKWLTKFLDWIERFFGDAGMADRTLFPRAFGLKKPAPLWTAPAFDRCLLLALIYPIATIFLIWAVSGHVGAAEAALGLKPDVPGWSRGLAAAAIGLTSFALWRGARAQGWKSRVWIAGVMAAAVAGAVAFAFAFADSANAGAFSGAVFASEALKTLAAATATFAVAFAAAFAVAVAVAFAGAFTGAVAFAVAFAVAVAFVVAFAIGDADPLSGAFAVIAAGTVAGSVAALSASAIKRRLQGIFLSLFLPAIILACLATADLLSPLETWKIVGPLLLFLGLLTLLNAPFDWTSLGLTRALLRRGLELGGWWPYSLALVDACLAGVIIALLSLTTVVGVQAFDELAVHGRSMVTSTTLKSIAERRKQEVQRCAEGFYRVDGTCLPNPGEVDAEGSSPGSEEAAEANPRGEEAAVLHLNEHYDMVLPLGKLFDGIAKNPGAPEYWWAYALLLSTMIPSLINLAISGMAFTRGIPGVSRLLLNWIPEGKAVPEYKRQPAAIGLTVQMFAGAFLGIAAQALLAWGLLFHLMPAIGLDLLDMARAVAAFDFPARVAKLAGFLALT